MRTAPPSASHHPAAFYAAGYSLDDPGEGLQMGRWRALGARAKAGPRGARCAPAPGSRRAAWSRSAAATARCSPRCRGGPAGDVDGFELSAPAVEIARGRGSRARAVLEAFDGARVPAADGAYDLAVLSHVLEHVPDPAALLREAARVAAARADQGAAGGQPAPLAAVNRAPRLIGSATPGARPRGTSRRSATGVGPRTSAALTDPLPLAHHAFFAEGAVARAKAAAKWAVRAGASEDLARGGREVLHRALCSVDGAPMTTHSCTALACGSPRLLALAAPRHRAP